MIQGFIGSRNIIAKIIACDSIMCGYICIRFIDFMLNNKNLLMLLVDFHHMILKKIKKIIERKK